MSRTAWDVSGSRLFQVGVDRGMFYTDDGVTSAVPWNGLVSITETPEGGDAQPFYLDGRKILNIAAGTDFAATIEALSAPIEFAPCAGRGRLSTGLYATDQPKQTFGFSYRTLIGNDVSGTRFAYKIHVVYNATAKTEDFIHSTDDASPSVKPQSWDITTYPIFVTGHRPTSHFVFDTRHNDDYIIARLEVILYGDDDNDPRLPTEEELRILLLTPPGITWWDLSGPIDFPDEAVIGDMGVDFDTDLLYTDVAPDNTAFWWDLTGDADFPAEASVGDWGFDTETGEVWKLT